MMDTATQPKEWVVEIADDFTTVKITWRGETKIILMDDVWKALGRYNTTCGSDDA